MTEVKFSPLTIALWTDLFAPKTSAEVLKEALGDCAFLDAIAQERRTGSLWGFDASAVLLGTFDGSTELAARKSRAMGDHGPRADVAGKAHFVAALYTIWKAAESSPPRESEETRQLRLKFAREFIHSAVIVSHSLESVFQVAEKAGPDRLHKETIYELIDRLVAQAFVLGNLDGVTELPTERRHAQAAIARSGATIEVGKRRASLRPHVEGLFRDRPKATSREIFRALRRRSPNLFPEKLSERTLIRDIDVILGRPPRRAALRRSS